MFLPSFSKVGGCSFRGLASLREVSERGREERRGVSLKCHIEVAATSIPCHCHARPHRCLTMQHYLDRPSLRNVTQHRQARSRPLDQGPPLKLVSADDTVFNSGRRAGFSPGTCSLASANICRPCLPVLAPKGPPIPRTEMRPLGWSFGKRK